MSVEEFEKMNNCKGKDVLYNEIEHLYFLGRAVLLNFDEYKSERNKIILLYSQMENIDKAKKQDIHWEFIRRLYNVLEAYYIFLVHIQFILIEDIQNKYKIPEFQHIKDDFEKFSTNIVAKFMRRLRAYIAHFNIPKTVIVQKLKSDRSEVEIFLNKEHLQNWKEWDKYNENNEVRAFIKNNKFIDISSILVECINNLSHFYNDLIKQIVETNRTNIEEYNSLIREWNENVMK